MDERLERFSNEIENLIVQKTDDDLQREKLFFSLQ